jgi:hypothetical protein
MRFFGQLCLLTAETAISFSGVVVTVYWLLLYKPGMYATNYQFYFNIVYHGTIKVINDFFLTIYGSFHLNLLFYYFLIAALTMVFMLIDFFLGRITFVWRHYWYCIIYGIVYMIINLIYSLSTGLPIYSVLFFVLHLFEFVFGFDVCSDSEMCEFETDFDVEELDVRSSGGWRVHLRRIPVWFVYVAGSCA